MRLIVALAVAALAFACSRTETPRSSAVAVRTLDAGAHTVEVRMPAHWEVARRDATLALRAPSADVAEISEVLLVDYAPATPKGMRDELVVARELWGNGNKREAQEHLRAIPIGSALLPSMKAPSAYASAWSRLLHPPGDMTPAQAEEHFATLQAGLEASSPAGLAILVDGALPVFDGLRHTSMRHTSGGDYEGQEFDSMAGRHDARRRDVVTRTSRTVNGHDAIEVETRDNLTHTGRRRMTFVVHADRLLVIASSPVGEGQSFTAYEGVRDSLVFRN